MVFAEWFVHAFVAALRDRREGIRERDERFGNAGVVGEEAGEGTRAVRAFRAGTDVKHIG